MSFQQSETSSLVRFQGLGRNFSLERPELASGKAVNLIQLGASCSMFLVVTSPGFGSGDRVRRASRQEVIKHYRPCRRLEVRQILRWQTARVLIIGHLSPVSCDIVLIDMREGLRDWSSSDRKLQSP